MSVILPKQDRPVYRCVSKSGFEMGHGTDLAPLGNVGQPVGSFCGTSRKPYLRILVVNPQYVLANPSVRPNGTSEQV